MRGSVKKDTKTGTWFVVVDNGTDPVTGKRRQIRRRGFRTRAYAETALDAIKPQTKSGMGYVEPSSESLKTYLEAWIKSVEMTVKPSTAAGYKQKMTTHVIPRIGGLPLRAVDAMTLNGLYADLLTDGKQNGKRGGLAPRTVGHVHTTLHRALRDAVKWGKLPVNPADHADPPRWTTPEMQVWSADQLRKFLDHVADDRLRAAVPPRGDDRDAPGRDRRVGLVGHHRRTDFRPSLPHRRGLRRRRG